MINSHDTCSVPADKKKVAFLPYWLYFKEYVMMDGLINTEY